MRHVLQALTALAVLVLACGSTLAQSSPDLPGDEPNDDPRGNVNIGTPIVVPLDPMSNAVHLGFGMTVGGGYNFTRRHGAIGEFMWNRMIPSNEAMAKVRTALKDPTLNASASVIAMTGNYRFELRGRALGAYLIGGGGLYYRKTSLSKEVTTGSNITCTPNLEWWGFTCESGTITANQTVGSWSASALGGNAGVGFTTRVGEAPYRFYIETRYHYAPNPRVNTQLIDISFGVRY